MRSTAFARFPLPILHRLGRAGGVIALVLSAIAASGAVWLWGEVGLGNGGALWSPRGVALSFGLAGGSVLLFVQAVTLLRGVAPRVRAWTTRSSCVASPPRRDP